MAAWLLLAAGFAAALREDELDPVLLQTKSVLERNDMVPVDRGALTCHDVDLPPEQRNREVFFLHISKAAGCSAMADLSRMVGRENVFSNEVCYSYMKQANYSKSFTILRRPRDHVLSMYEYCKYGDNMSMSMMLDAMNFGGPSPLPATFQEWIERWYTTPAFGSHGMFFDPSHCYCPYNMQTSRMVCEDHFQSSYCYPNPDLQLALQHLDSLTAVGVVEAYQESMCLFEYKVTGVLPFYCDCEKRFDWYQAKMTSIHESSGVSYSQKIDDYGAPVLEKVDGITALDAQLYRHGVERFIKELDDLGSHLGKKILCDSVRAELQQKAGIASI